MRRSWISVVLILSFAVAGAVTPKTSAQESGPPKAPSVQPVVPKPGPKYEPKPAIPPTPIPAQMAPPTYPPQTPVPGPQYIAPPAPPAPPKQAPVECHRVVYHLRAIPAVDAAGTLEQLLRTEEKRYGGRWRVAIVSNTARNSLLVSGPPKELEEVGRLIDELDRVPVMVRIEVVIGEVGEKGEMEILARAELTTLDNQSARLQMGRREPRVTGIQRTPKGTMNTLTFENVGTQLSLTPRVGPDDVVTLEIDVEDSRLGPEEEGAVIATDSTGKTLRTPSTRTLVCESTLRIPSGETVTLAGMGREAESAKKRVVQVTAEVVKGGKGKG